MTPKLLSPEELECMPEGTALSVEEWRRVRSHIAALKAELAEVNTVANVQTDKALRAEADNAAWQAAVNDALNYVHMNSCDMGGNHRYTLTRNHGRAVAFLQHMADQPHPGTALLSEHAKALARARNEGLERAAVRLHEAPVLETHRDTVKAIRAMKETEG